MNNWGRSRRSSGSSVPGSPTGSDRGFSFRTGGRRKSELEREREKSHRHRHGHGHLSAASKSYSPQGLTDNEDIEADALQITAVHAVGFIMLSSSFLLIMFFVNIYFFVSILYLLSAGLASSKVFFYPFFNRLIRTYTAIRLDVEIDDVPDNGGPGECYGINTAMVLSGKTKTNILLSILLLVLFFFILS